MQPTTIAGRWRRLTVQWQQSVFAFHVASASLGPAKPSLNVKSVVASFAEDDAA